MICGGPQKMAQNRQNLRKLIGNDTRGGVSATVSLGGTKKDKHTQKSVFSFCNPRDCQPKWVRSTSVGQQTPRKLSFVFPLSRGRNL